MSDLVQRRPTSPIVILFGAAVLGVVGLGDSACRRTPKLPQPTCFEVTASSNSEGTRKVFAERHCQGGGVTWAAILNALVARKGKATPVLGMSPGWTGDVYVLNGDTHFSIDDSADVALFCSDSSALLASIERNVGYLNRESDTLRRMLKTLSPWALECLDVDGGLPPLPEEWPEELRRQLRSNMESGAR